MNAETPTPSGALKKERVETMHQPPARDEEIVRAYGKMNRRRRAEMTRPPVQPRGVTAGKRLGARS